MHILFVRTKPLVFAGLSLVVALWSLSAPALAETKPCALVLMHGKWGSPNSMQGMGRQLDVVCDTVSIEMPWSRRRNYDQPYTAALAEVAAQVQSLRTKKYARVLLVGHSFGANGALAYMAEVGDVDGVVALAPGHSPESIYRRGAGKAAVDQARSLVAEGKPGEMLDMEDLNQGKTRTVRMRADVLLSYFDPQGLGHMPLTVTRFKKPVPLLWVVGTQDPMYPAGAAYAFDKAPAHTASKYLVVEADHMGTPEAAAAQVVEWIKALP